MVEVGLGVGEREISVLESHGAGVAQSSELRSEGWGRHRGGSQGEQS